MDEDDKTKKSEVVNEDWHFDVVRTYVLGVEILDMRLSDGEFRLLSLLRLRASGGRNNHVSYATLAKDLDTSDKTIGRAMANLQKNGYVVCKSRGLSQSTLKTITSMVERYDGDVLKMSRKDILSSDRDEDLLRRLHCIDNAKDRPSRTDLSTLDSKGKNGVHTGQICPTVPDIFVPPERTNMSVKVNEGKVNEKEVDDTRSARDESKFRKIGISENGEKYDLTTGEVLEALVPPTHDLGEDEIRPETPDPRDADRKFAVDLEVQTRARTDRATQGQRKKVRERQAADAQSGALEERKKRMEQERLERLEARRSGGRFYGWAKQEYERFFPDIIMAPWGNKEFNQLKTLVGFYKDDEGLIRRGWSYCCENWEHLQKKWKIAENAPSIGILLGFRERVFLTIQNQMTDRHIIERTFVKKKPGEW
jgi:biotin operon repressor